MTDAEIIKLYWERDQQAIQLTAEKYEPYCSRIAQNILQDPGDAEECVNDTWLGAWNSMPPQKPQVLAAFLGKLTRNLAINRYRHNTAQKRGGGQAVMVLEELGDLVSGADNVAQEIDRRELVSAINAFLSTLPAEKRSIFLRRYWYFESVADIAVKFGMNENQVSVLLYRLREKLRKHLEKGGFTL
ncbi:MAG: sigma-70 family RNA polymerase sigma factor [Lachnospiraceae bacterium]|nr:sigma-70 family RNA polymerase sigma factor [Lachnospiraceae bacterium]